jgi:hypothetical protein
MTMTLKLPPLLERDLRRRSAALGVPASVILREALTSYLAAHSREAPSAWALGEDLFGRHAGPANLAVSRKAELGRALEEKARRRRHG